MSIENLFSKDHAADLIAAICSGTYHDVFAVLGPHRTATALLIHAFIPGAEHVAVIDSLGGAEITTMNAIGTQGFFQSSLPASASDEYALRITYPQSTVDIEDPYRFPSTLSDLELYLLGEGTLERAYDLLGARVHTIDDVSGTLFSVWAPNARRASVVGDFNHWDGRRHVMRFHPANGVWELFFPGLGPGALYKFEILGHDNVLRLKADPFARAMQRAPETASIIPRANRFEWHDHAWLSGRTQWQPHREPISIYEVHAGSWRRNEDGNYLTFRQLAEQLIPYVLDLGFTHIQLMPVSEFPFDGSWGYQSIGLFAPSRRFGEAHDFAHFVDSCHQAGIGVIADWVPAHFPSDAHGLAHFDGTCLFEHQDTRRGYHPDWNTLIYNYGRGEVISFLISNAQYWLTEFHLDGLRVDAVSSMLYHDYSRKPGEWLPNQYGGHENLEAMALLRSINSRVYAAHPGVMMIAEESTSWPRITKPVHEDGLGFGFKWNMGWMHDTLRYMGREPIYRKYHHNDITFGLLYAFSENFVLPLSHDEVVHGKKSLLERMPGDEWQKFANLRAYLGLMWAYPGKKLLFMGGEFGQRNEWNHDTALDWWLLEYERHRGLRELVKDLNRMLREVPALFRLDCDPTGFEWIDANNTEQSIFSFIRRSPDESSLAVVVSNMTPVIRYDYRIGVPQEGIYRERVNTDSASYGGTNQGNFGAVITQSMPCHGRHWSLSLTLPPLATLILQYDNTV